MTDAPQWFLDAVAAPAHVAETTVDAIPISYRTWGEAGSGAHDLLLVHGGGAHARWWDHIAPLLATDRRVVAMDMSGHGDSGHRSAYSLDGWADELAAVIAAAGMRERPVVIGHSLGGMVTTVLARRGTPQLAGAIIVDSPIGGPSPRAEADSPSFGNARLYPTAAAVIERFRPIPAQEVLGYIADHVAETSVREVEGGWTWKFDPAFVGLTGDLPGSLDGLPCPVVYIAGEHGILLPAARTAMDESAEVTVIEIPGAGHAIMLDQPLALVDAVRGVVAEWERSERAA